MTCATCIHSQHVSHDITSPGGFYWVAVEQLHCKLHDMYVEDNELCDDQTPDNPAQ